MTSSAPLALLPISVVILTLNAEKTLGRALKSALWAREVIVYDTGSSDATRSLALSHQGVTLIEGPFVGFGPTRQRATQHACQPWVLMLDADEWLEEEALLSLSQVDFSVQERVYCFRRKNFYRGRWIRGCGWWPDRQKRLFCRHKTRYNDQQVHEAILTSPAITSHQLDATICHEPYEDLAHFLRKLNLYSTLFAKENLHKKRSSPLKALIHALFAFIRSYLLRGGVFLGYEGWYISLYQAHSALYKYLKLYEEQSRSSRVKRP